MLFSFFAQVNTVHTSVGKEGRLAKKQGNKQGGEPNHSNNPFLPAVGHCVHLHWAGANTFFLGLLLLQHQHIASSPIPHSPPFMFIMCPRPVLLLLFLLILLSLSPFLRSFLSFCLYQYLFLPCLACLCGVRCWWKKIRCFLRSCRVVVVAVDDRGAVGVGGGGGGGAVEAQAESEARKEGKKIPQFPSFLLLPLLHRRTHRHHHRFSASRRE